jgi:hypothetical protein
VRVPTLAPGELAQELVRRGLDQSVAEQVDRYPEGADVGVVRHVLLDLLVRERAARADGAVVDQRPSFDDHLAARDRHPRGLKSALRIAQAGAELGHLAAAAGEGVLVAFAARLRVVQGPKSIGNVLDVVEHGLIVDECRLIDRTVRLAVEARGRFLRAGGGHVGFRAQRGRRQGNASNQS